MKKMKLRKWVKVVLFIMLIALIVYFGYRLFTKKTIYTTPGGTYVCNGTLVQVCSGSKEVAEYLGV